MIHYLPLEHLDARYTLHLDKSITDYLDWVGWPYMLHYPDMEGRERDAPPPGYFLNAPATIEFKARQLASLAEYGLEDGDIVFCSDLWFPGIEGVEYLAHFTGKNIRLRGLLHAGSFTDTDFVRALERWAAPFENMVLDIAERVYVGSEFMRSDVLSKRTVAPDKVIVTGFPLDPHLDRLKPKVRTPKNPIVVFTGRICDEKQPWLFDELAERVSAKWGGDPVTWVKTQGRERPRWEYYELLARAHAVVSFALQENFGFSILEAVKLGCVPVVPDRLAYPEFFDVRYRYHSMDEAVDLVLRALAGEIAAPSVPSFDDAVARWFA